MLSHIPRPDSNRALEGDGEQPTEHLAAAISRGHDLDVLEEEEGRRKAAGRWAILEPFILSSGPVKLSTLVS